jgi:hypothetical protein
MQAVELKRVVLYVFGRWIAFTTMSLMRRSLKQGFVEAGIDVCDPELNRFCFPKAAGVT